MVWWSYISPRIRKCECLLNILMITLYSSVLNWQRAFSPEGLSEMWNEMVKDEEIIFNGEESAHPGMAIWDLLHHVHDWYTLQLLCYEQELHHNLTKWKKGDEKTSFDFLEDCTDCFGTQKKDESNDKEKKEEEETSTSVHHSIIETWDWGRQPGERGPWARFKCLTRHCVLKCPLFPSIEMNTRLAAGGFKTPKCLLHTVSTHGKPQCLSSSSLSDPADV